MAKQLSSDDIPSTNDERIPLPSLAEVLPLENKAVVISESGHVNDDDHVERPKTRQENSEEDNIVEESSGLQDVVSSSASCLPCKHVLNSSASCEAYSTEEDNGRERLKRHRIEMADRVWIPDIWGKEDLLKDWIDYSAFDACLVPKGLMSARAALVEEGRRATSGRLRIENRKAEWTTKRKPKPAKWGRAIKRTWYEHKAINPLDRPNWVLLLGVFAVALIIWTSFKGKWYVPRFSSAKPM